MMFVGDLLHVGKRCALRINLMKSYIMLLIINILVEDGSQGLFEGTHWNCE